MMCVTVGCITRSRADALRAPLTAAPDGLNPVKVISSDRGIIYDGKGHCNTLKAERLYA